MQWNGLKELININKKILLLFLVLPIQAIASNSDSELLDLFHDRGINHCDKFILQHASLKDKGSYSYTVESPGFSFNKGYSEVILIEVLGKKGDTTKRDLTFMETPRECFVTKRATIIFDGSCQENVDGQYWSINDEMEGLDYTGYRNKHKVSMLTKELNAGNLKYCVQEYRLAAKSDHD